MDYSSLIEYYFDLLYGEYLHRRSLLNLAYKKIEEDTRLKKYSAREVFFNLYSTSEAAQRLYSFYSNLEFKINNSLKSKIRMFEEACAIDEIIFTKPQVDIQEVSYNQLEYNLDDSVKRLHLVEPYLQGISKVIYSMYHRFPQIQIIKDYGYSAFMNTNDEIKIQINRIFIDFELLFHMFAHEAGHSEYFQEIGEAINKQNIAHLKYSLPNSFSLMNADSAKEELLADFFAAVTFAVYDAPFHKVYSRFMRNSRINKEEKLKFDYYVDEELRANFLKNVILTLKNHFTHNSKWNLLAKYYKDISGVNFLSFPSPSKINDIYKQSRDKNTQLLLLQSMYPALFTATNDFLYPSNIMIQDGLLQSEKGARVYNFEELAIKFAYYTEFISIDEFQNKYEGKNRFHFPSNYNFMPQTLRNPLPIRTNTQNNHLLSGKSKLPISSSSEEKTSFLNRDWPSGSFSIGFPKSYGRTLYRREQMRPYDFIAMPGPSFVVMGNQDECGQPRFQQNEFIQPNNIGYDVGFNANLMLTRVSINMAGKVLNRVKNSNFLQFFNSSKYSDVPKKNKKLELS